MFECPYVCIQGRNPQIKRNVGKNQPMSRVIDKIRSQHLPYNSTYRPLVAQSGEAELYNDDGACIGPGPQPLDIIK